MENKNTNSIPEKSSKFNDILGNIRKSLAVIGYAVTFAVLIALGIIVWIFYQII